MQNHSEEEIYLCKAWDVSLLAHSFCLTLPKVLLIFGEDGAKHADVN